MTEKADFKKSLDCYRAKRDTPQLVSVPEMQYLKIDGYGDPNTAVFATAIAALYPVAYTLKFASKNDLGRDYVVPPLEGLWWADDMSSFTDARDKTRWHWTAMLMTPDWIPQDMFSDAVERVAAKKRPERLEDVRLEPLAEDLCVQALHVGSYDDEAALLNRMHHEFIPKRGLTMVGTHHEIYLSDPRRAASEKLKTILRQPVVEASQ